MKLTGDIEDVVFHEVAGTPAPASSPHPDGRARRAPRAAPVERRIGLQHLAFFRGYLEGLDLAVRRSKSWFIAEVKFVSLADRRAIRTTVVSAERLTHFTVLRKISRPRRPTQ
jgi:hypothetical protein